MNPQAKDDGVLAELLSRLEELEGRNSQLIAAQVAEKIERQHQAFALQTKVRLICF